MIYLFLCMFCLAFGLFFIRSVYFSSVSCVKIFPTISTSTYVDYYVLPVKPTKKFFRTLAAGQPYSYVSLGNGYVAFYVADFDNACLSFNDFEFTSTVYVFKVSRFGRYKSVDLADRCLNDTILKFKGV